MQRKYSAHCTISPGPYSGKVFDHSNHVFIEVMSVCVCMFIYVLAVYYDQTMPSIKVHMYVFISVFKDLSFFPWTNHVLIGMHREKSNSTMMNIRVFVYE